MGKSKQSGARLGNRPAFSRMSYLYQAASYLSTCDNVSAGGKPAPSKTTSKEKGLMQQSARRLVSDMRAVGLKTQVRIDPSIKQTVCKYCDTLLIEGQTCRSFVENKSKGARKPWADVLVVKCTTCCREKRYPVSASRQQRRHVRQSVRHDASVEASPKADASVEESAIEQTPTSDAAMTTN